MISDEIHADFVYEGYTHHVFANIKPEFEAISVTCTAPSKTFNLAGLQVSNIFIPNIKLRKKFQLEMERSGSNQVGIMGLVSCQAAYQYGEAWLSELNTYLASNLSFIRNFLSENLPEIHLI
ncbi:MAG: aminotransferase, partial [Eubacterium sp.]